ncbi:arginine--tRNA ligase [Amycolatopsis thailandensis]|uniref:Arginine--tRNA ligase n=1 Tax=Amycolatopsis thailandensis TaxID=589330 RepID=A0A229RR55_9PSEU|nr:arginine--tRNA ligase [Amycolatopsis thailandensis]OXM48949.1 arginine--tRNA ligase [Amycolatopsis thailandensis]
MLFGDVSEELARRVMEALRHVTDIEPPTALVRVSSQSGVDYQCDLAMSLGKRLGEPPREIAAAIASHLDVADLAEPPVVAGPGFLNFTLSSSWLEDRTSALGDDPRLGAGVTPRPRRIAIDYSSPNVAKEMHAGHLRSTVIGDAITRLLRFAGHDVIPHNHLGDWGTPFGMLIEHLLDERPSGPYTIGDLNGFYRAARSKFDADEDFATRSRERVVLLQSGDEETLSSWRHLVDESTRHFAQVYELLGIGLSSEDVYGESFYNPFLATVVDELAASGLTEISDGAVCVFPDGFRNREGEPLPLIVRKRDGGYGYAVTDLATLRYWTGQRGVTDLLYVVGAPQAQHFAMVFAVCRAAGWLREEHRAEHIGFGTVLGEDGRAMKTRAGESVRLSDLLTEAIAHAAGVIDGRDDLSPEIREEVARAIGIGAIKYADLSGDRERDYVFSWERMLSKNGNTSVYLQYANARIRSVLAKADQDLADARVLLGHPTERALALALVRFPEAVGAATAGHLPHKLCTYLYETAAVFSRFYEQCPVLDAKGPGVRDSRLLLAELTSKTLTLGLSLLGISTPARL